MSTESCPTVRIKSDNEDGYCVINASSFDEKVHVLFVEPKAPVSEAPADEPKVKAKWAKGETK
jgi:hypothetical protein